MQIQINTGRNVEGREALSADVSGLVECALSRATRVEIYVSDENGFKHSQSDIRCMMESRLEGRQPVAVTHQAATLDEAVEGAAGKLNKLIERALGPAPRSKEPNN